MNIGAWLAQRPVSLVQSQETIRAQVQWARILDKPTSIRFLRNGTRMAAQTVRIEFDDTFSNTESEAGNSTLRRVLLFGVEGHPTIPDLDVNLWDTFVIDQSEYTVVSVNDLLIGQVQAYCEMVG
jgi:hypothetical protein